MMTKPGCKERLYGLLAAAQPLLLKKIHPTTYTFTSITPLRSASS